MKKIYVGNLSFNSTDDTLQEAFGAFGTVLSATIVQDRETNRSRGFGFVEMENDADADEAIAKMNEKELDGRTLTVNEAKPRADRNGGGGNRGGGRGARW